MAFVENSLDNGMETVYNLLPVVNINLAVNATEWIIMRKAYLWPDLRDTGNDK